jgi:hypothetical protein
MAVVICSAPFLEASRTAPETNLRSCADVPRRNLNEHERERIIKQRRRIKCTKAYGSIFDRIRGDVRWFTRVFIKYGNSPEPAKSLDSYVIWLREQNEELCNFYKNTPEISDQAWLCIKEKLLEYQREIALKRREYEKELEKRPPPVGQVGGGESVWLGGLLSGLTDYAHHLSQKAQSIGDTMKSIQEEKTGNPQKKPAHGKCGP